MKANSRERLSTVLVGAVLMAILPLSMAFVLDNARAAGAIDEGGYGLGLRFFYVLSWPANLFSMLFWDAANFWRTDIGAEGFVRSITVYLASNLVGWGLALLAVQSTIARLRRRSRSRPTR